jgi:hypothetical protein
MGNQGDVSDGEMQGMTEKSRFFFGPSIDHPHRTPVYGPPIEARTGKIGWEYVGQYSLGYYQEFRTLFDTAH